MITVYYQRAVESFTDHAKVLTKCCSVPCAYLAAALLCEVRQLEQSKMASMV